MNGKRVMKLASRGKRFGAGVIDALIPFISYLVFTAVLAANGIRYSPYNGYGYGYGYEFDMGYNYGSRLSGPSAAIITIISLLLIAYVVVEFVFFAKGKSIGKAVLGLQVVSSSDGKPFRFWRMMFREIIVKQASSAFLLGFIWILIDEKNRGWHDKILDSYVVDLKESEKLNHRKRPEHTAAAVPEAEKTAAPEAAKTPAPEQAPVPEKAPAPAPAPEEETAKAEDIPAPAAAAAKEAETAEAEPETEPEIEIETIAVSEAAEVVESIAEKVMETAAAPAVSMSMKKAELLEAAREAGVKVGSKATKAEIIEAIRKASENE